MTIIDFYGLPGSGKSIVSHVLADELRNNGYTVEEPSWMTDRLPSWQRLGRKLFASIAYSLCHLSILKAAMRKSGNAGLLSKTKMKLWINTSYIMHMIEKPSVCDYRIFDQGIFQAVVSLYTENELDTYRELYNMLMCQLSEPVIPVYVSVAKRIAVERMAGRSGGKSRAEKLGNDARQKMLDRIGVLCEKMDSSGILFDNSGSERNLEPLMVEIQERAKNA
jgi:thymidylate kinase